LGKTHPQNKKTLQFTRSRFTPPTCPEATRYLKLPENRSKTECIALKTNNITESYLYINNSLEENSPWEEIMTGGI
jgi:hypothetical protein